MENFSKAKFDNLINAFCALNILIYSQFRTEDFESGPTLLSGRVDSYYSGESSNGGYLMIKEPSDWNLDEQYEFNWSDLKNEPDRFVRFDYDSVSF